ncbi:MAG: transposase [Planctomycetota bacterium]|nr:MAG: transposase [Planctomycetota bacterium]
MTDIQSKGYYKRGFIPHFDYSCLHQMITYRLNDSLPRHAVELMLIKDDEQKKRKLIETYLDAGHGSCILKIKDIADLIFENWNHFNGKRYDLISYVIMPNHIHILIKIYEKEQLGKIIHSWKSYTSKKIKKYLNINGKDSSVGWKDNYWDRYIRDTAHYQHAINYIHQNPVKAGLCSAPEDWKYSSIKKYTSKPNKS